MASWINNSFKFPFSRFCSVVSVKCHCHSVSHFELNCARLSKLDLLEDIARQKTLLFVSNRINYLYFKCGTMCFCQPSRWSVGFYNHTIYKYSLIVYLGASALADKSCGLIKHSVPTTNTMLTCAVQCMYETIQTW